MDSNNNPTTIIDNNRQPQSIVNENRRNPVEPIRGGQRGVLISLSLSLSLSLSHLSSETAVRLRTEAMADSTSAYLMSLQMAPASSRCLTKYCSVSSGAHTSSSSRSAADSDTRNSVVAFRDCAKNDRHQNIRNQHPRNTTRFHPARRNQFSHSQDVQIRLGHLSWVRLTQEGIC